MSATATKTNGTAAPARPETIDVELGFPPGLTRPVYTVEAGTEAEAFRILTDWFRRGLRVVPRA